VHDVHFKRRPESLSSVIATAAKVIGGYAKVALGTRQKLVYEPSPMLTKAVFAEPVGTNEEGFSLLHDFVDADTPYSLRTVDSLLRAAVAGFLGQDEEQIAGFEADTRAPGVRAARRLRVVAAATSLAVNFLCSYRADGRNVVTAKGADFQAVESWLRQTARSPIEANDCDGSAKEAMGLLNAATGVSEKDAEEFAYLRGFKNVLVPFYIPALAVLGATSAEAGSADASETRVAGHAMLLAMPAVGALRAMSSALPHTLGDQEQPVCAQEKRARVDEARFRAMFSEEATAGLPEDERALLESWHTAKDSFAELTTMAIEGTTPSDPTLYESDPAVRAEIEADAANDDAAFSKTSPNVWRGVKLLHVGGKPHRFYREFVEMTVSRRCPLYASDKVRALGVAASQFVLCADTYGKNLRRAGASPKDLASDAFKLVPLVCFDQGANRSTRTAPIYAFLGIPARRTCRRRVRERIARRRQKGDCDYRLTNHAFLTRAPADLRWCAFWHVSPTSASFFERAPRTSST
jgi:hypothetical protein